jgi:DNA (cytosine-5)-methyltransferase 1
MQFTFDHYEKERYVIDKPMRLIELFAGIGAFSKALTRLGASFEHHRVCDSDKFKIQAYNAVHGTDFVPTDIETMHGSELGIADTDKWVYILTYSFPCVDLSNAGKRQGMTRGGSTRSGLLWEVERLITETDNLPQVLIMENVPQVHGQTNVDCFREWSQFLVSMGYTNNYQDLNARDFGIPQNRNRCFMVSLLEGYYVFPDAFPLNETLADRLEDEVEERFYLSDEHVAKIRNNTFAQQRERIHGGGGVSNTLFATDYKRPPCIADDTYRRQRQP